MGLQSLPHAIGVILSRAGSPVASVDRLRSCPLRAHGKDRKNFSEYGTDALLRRWRARGLRSIALLPRILAQRQHRPGAAREDAVGLFLFLPSYVHRQPRHALG